MYIYNKIHLVIYSMQLNKAFEQISFDMSKLIIYSILYLKFKILKS